MRRVARPKMRTFRCPSCGRITETLGLAAWCPRFRSTDKPHVKPVKMRELKREGA